ncbi:uncharacterized protein NPIL_691011 [Nephila pilipes]|uniref:Uncharacterized protein n=1 Tax=Nephila pilipes TaxID=299642 RepID=A0A8X6P850_NEPPI|nr:uncharacterized protein NPIL_691011 [Nephila pilipes]
MLDQFSISYGHTPEPANLESFYQQEVADFENWFQEKIQNHEIETPQTSEDSADRHKKDHHRYPQQSTFQKPAEEHQQVRDEDHHRRISSKPRGESFHKEHPNPLTSTNQDTGNDNLRNSKSHLEPILPSVVDKMDRQLEAYLDNLLHPVKGRDDGTEHDTEYSKHKHDENRKQHHHIEDIIYIHKSDSDDSIDSSAEFLDEALSSDEPEKKPDKPQIRLVAEDFPDDPMAQDVCSVSKNYFNDKKTCSSNKQYTFEPHVSSTYSKNVRKQMKKRYAKHRDADDSMCDYRTEGADLDVTERALCPFTWNVSKKNSARIPEYLYEAKCACQVSRGVTHSAVCVELKSKIRVLWRVGCENNLHVYKEGWEEIAVACVPVGQATGESQPGARIKLPPLSSSQT